MMNRGGGIGIGIGIINSPATTTHVGNSSGWLFEGTKWTAEENKVFESALALFDKDTPDRWYNVAAMIPGKTVNDVIKQYRELEEDVCDIEAGLIPVPGYSNSSSRRRNSSFTLEWEGGSGLYSHGGKRQTSSRTFEQERKKGVPWTEEEHRLFLMGLKKYGKGDWRTISRNFVTSRTPTQVASHAQKYFIRQVSAEGGSGNGKEMKRRSSIHDITTAHLNLINNNNNGKSSSIISPENNSPCSTSHSNITTTTTTTTTKTDTISVSKATSKYWNNMESHDQVQGLGTSGFNNNNNNNNRNHHQLQYDFPNAFC